MTEARAGWRRREVVAGLGAASVLAAGFAAHGRDVVVDESALLPGEFSWRPELSAAGPVAVIVSIPEQRVHVYRNGVRIGLSTCSTGKPGHETPTGVFTILQKDKNHHSSIYNNASMPNAERLTWGGVALHAGGLPGYPSSHGCVHLPLEFSDRVFEITHVGTPVVLAGAASDPWELTHPGLVLGSAAEGELAAAVAKLNMKSEPTDWAAATGPVATVIATGADRRITLIVDGVQLFADDLTVTGDGPLGEHLLVLQGADPSQPGGGLRWRGLSYAPGGGESAATEAGVLARLSASEAFLVEVNQRLAQGMTMVISDLDSDPARRSGADFVIMTGGPYDAAPPMPRPGDGDAVQKG